MLKTFIKKLREPSKNNLGIPDSTIDMLAREILNFTRNYLATEEGRKDFEEWKRDARKAAEAKK